MPKKAYLFPTATLVLLAAVIILITPVGATPASKPLAQNPAATQTAFARDDFQPEATSLPAVRLTQTAAARDPFLPEPDIMPTFLTLAPEEPPPEPTQEAPPTEAESADTSGAEDDDEGSSTIWIFVVAIGVPVVLVALLVFGRRGGQSEKDSA